MNDDFLSGLRETPRPAFADALKSRLDAIDDEHESRTAARSRWLRPVLAAATTLAVVTVALAVPAVRASALNLLEVFRVKRFAAVPLDASRFERLHQQNLDMKTLMSGRVQTLQDPGAPQLVADVATAAARVGFPLAQPKQLPQGLALADVQVTGRGSVEVTLDMDRLAELASALDVKDLEIPYELNGSIVRIDTSPAAALRYTRGKDEFRLFQARNPEIGLPDGAELPRLGAIGLQLAGMSAAEARAFAARIDWRSTLLVPVPAIGGDFRDVAIGDAQGLLVTVRPPRQAQADGSRPLPRLHSVLLWSKGDRVFALQGPGLGVELVQIANAIG